MTGGRERDSILSDALEAVIGSIYLDGGLDPARNFIMCFVLNDMENSRLFHDCKTILQENIQKFEGVTVPVGHLDITLHRDDLSNEEKQKRSQESVFPCDITGKTVIIVDDVLYTGRTARAAMEAVITKGRPKYIQLAVLVDRGHRELPIRADFVGKNVPTAKSENVQVRLMDNDGENAVYIER